jgi:hypothetical protein
MTQKEEMAALGQLVTDHQEVKRRMVALEQEIQRVGYRLIELGTKFLPETPGRFSDTDISGYSDVLDAGKIGEMVSDWRQATKRLREIEQGLEQLGVQR